MLISSWSHSPLDKRGTVKARLALVTIPHPSQDFGARLSRFRIERDHLAPRITVGDGNHGLRADLEPATEKRVLGETAHAGQIRIYVCPKPPLVQGQAYFV